MFDRTAHRGLQGAVSLCAAAANARIERATAALVRPVELNDAHSAGLVDGRQLNGPRPAGRITASEAAMNPRRARARTAPSSGTSRARVPPAARTTTAPTSHPTASPEQRPRRYHRADHQMDGCRMPKAASTNVGATEPAARGQTPSGLRFASRSTADRRETGDKVVVGRSEMSKGPPWRGEIPVVDRQRQNGQRCRSRVGPEESPLPRGEHPIRIAEQQRQNHDP